MIADILLNIKQIDYFEKYQNITVIPIQDYGRLTKFKIKADEDYFTLITKDDVIKFYLERVRVLGNEFKKIVGFVLFNTQYNYLFLNYPGEDKGKSLNKISKEEISDSDSMEYIIQLNNALNEFHRHKCPYIDFSSQHYRSWFDYIFEEIRYRLEKIKDDFIISEESMLKVLKNLKANEELFHQDNCYIHADATCTNIVINTQQKKLYFIDFDDFKIGDPFYDISRLGNFRYIKVIDNYLTNNYPNLEKDLRHNFYTLRTVLVWYLHIKNNHQEDKYELPIKELQELVIKCA